MPARLRYLVAAAATLLALRCAYYNTFYNAQVLFRDGIKLVDASNAGAAKDKFNSAIKKSAAVIKDHPKSQWVDEALLMVGKCYYQLGDYTKAIAKFENLRAVFPDSRFRDEAQYWQALALIDDKQYAQGLLLLDELKDGSARFRDDATFQTALTYFKQTDYAGAIQAFQDYQAGFPRSARRRELLGLLADCYFRLGRYDDAGQTYRRLRQLVQTSRARLETDLKLAECLLLAGRPESTLVLLMRQADRFAEFNDRINLLSGKAFFALGKKKEAHSSLSKVRGGTDAAEANLLIGKSHEQDTNFTLALAYYDSAKMRGGNSPHAVQATQRRLLISRLLAGRKGASDTAEAQFLLAEVYHLNLEQDSQAIIRYQKVADSFPNSPFAPKALYAIAWLRARRLRDTDSLLAYQTVVERYPRTIYAQAARTVLGQPLLPEAQIEKPPPPRRDTGRTVSGVPGDTSRLARSDTLARSGEELAAGDKGLEGREKRRGRERRERGDRPAPGPDTSLASRLRPAQAGGSTPPGMKPGPSEFKPPIPGRESSSRPEPPPPVRPEPEEPAPPPPEPALKPESLPPVKPESAVAVEKTSPETAASPTPAPGTAKPAEPPTVPESLAGPIHFDFDRATIKARDTAVLRAVADRLRQTPDALVLVSGYCDPRGDAEYNAELGLRRAEAVRDWLVQQGIDTHRIDIESWGASAVETAEPARYWAERRCEIHIPGQGK